MGRRKKTDLSDRKPPVLQVVKESEKKWSLGRGALIGSLIIAHIWGFILIFSVLFGREASVIGTMFDTVGFMIFTTLAVLVGGKAWKSFEKMKWSGKDDITYY